MLTRSYNILRTRHFILKPDLNQSPFQSGTTVALVEHYMKLRVDYCTNIDCLDHIVAVVEAMNDQICHYLL